tara:strand:- start:2 stop:133 length:132 start_codon:yes stop_codon:yes gene_type:complete
MSDVRIHLILDIDLMDYLDDLWKCPLEDLVDLSDATVESIQAR